MEWSLEMFHEIWGLALAVPLPANMVSCVSNLGRKIFSFGFSVTEVSRATWEISGAHQQQGSANYSCPVCIERRNYAKVLDEPGFEPQ